MNANLDPQPPGEPGRKAELPETDLPQSRPTLTLHLPATRPYVCYTILALTIAVFLLQLLSRNLLGVDYPAALGAKVNQAIVAGQLWRLLTPVLLHASLIHIGFNMYALYVIGAGLERYYGHKRFLGLYLLAAFSGNVISFLFSPNPSYGASTAVFGLVAAEGIFILRNRFLFGENARSMLMNIIVIVVINLLLGLSPGIDNWGHLGGLIGGAALAWFAGPILKVSGAAPEFHLKDTRPAGRVRLAFLGVFCVFAAIAAWVIMAR